jgi:hypothetical protein
MLQVRPKRCSDPQLAVSALDREREHRSGYAQPLGHERKGSLMPSTFRLLRIVPLAVAVGGILSACTGPTSSSGTSSTTTTSTTAPATSSPGTTAPATTTLPSAAALAHDEQAALTLLCGPTRPIPTFAGQPTCGLSLVDAEAPDGRSGTLYAIQYVAAQTSGADAPVYFFDGETFVGKTGSLRGRSDVLAGAAGTAMFSVHRVAFKTSPGTSCASATGQSTLVWTYAFNGTAVASSSTPAPPAGYTFDCLG